MVRVVRIDRDASDGRTHRLDELAHIRRDIVLRVDVLHAGEAVQLTVPTAYEHVVTGFWFNVYREFHSLRTGSCRRVAQANPVRSRVEVQSIACHPDAIATIKSCNGHGGVRIAHLQTTGYIVQRIRSVEVNGVAHFHDIVHLYFCKSGVVANGVVHPLVPVLNVNRVNDWRDVCNDEVGTRQGAVRVAFQLGFRFLRIQPEVIRIFRQRRIQHALRTLQHIVIRKLNTFGQRVFEIQILVGCRQGEGAVRHSLSVWVDQDDFALCVGVIGVFVQTNHRVELTNFTVGVGQINDVGIPEVSVVGNRARCNRSA